MQLIFEFDNERLFCKYNCKRVSVGDRGIFANDLSYLGYVITRCRRNSGRNRVVLSLGKGVNE